MNVNFNDRQPETLHELGKSPGSSADAALSSETAEFLRAQLSSEQGHRSETGLWARMRQGVKAVKVVSTLKRQKSVRVALNRLGVASHGSERKARRDLFKQLTSGSLAQKLDKILAADTQAAATPPAQANAQGPNAAAAPVFAEEMEALRQEEPSAEGEAPNTLPSANAEQARPPSFLDVDPEDEFSRLCLLNRVTHAFDYNVSPEERAVANFVLDKVFLRERESLTAGDTKAASSYMVGALRGINDDNGQLSAVLGPDLANQAMEVATETASLLRDLTVDANRFDGVVDTVLSRMASLEPGQSMVFSSLFPTHEVYVLVERDENPNGDAVGRVKIFNTGLGLEAHHAQAPDGRYQTFLEYHDIPFGDLTNRASLASIIGHDGDINGLYEALSSWCQRGEKAEPRDPETESEYYEQSQTTGSCAFQTQMALLRERLFMVASTPQEGFALYKLMKAKLMREFTVLTQGRLAEPVRRAVEIKQRVQDLGLAMAVQLAEPSTRGALFDELAEGLGRISPEARQEWEERTSAGPLSSAEAYRLAHAAVKMLVAKGVRLYGQTAASKLVTARVVRMELDVATEVQHLVQDIHSGKQTWSDYTDRLLKACVTMESGNARVERMVAELITLSATLMREDQSDASRDAALRANRVLEALFEINPAHFKKAVMAATKLICQRQTVYRRFEDGGPLKLDAKHSVALRRLTLGLPIKFTIDRLLEQAGPEDTTFLRTIKREMTEAVHAAYTEDASSPRPMPPPPE